MDDRDEKWRIFQLFYENFQSVSKAQDFYVRVLMLFLGLVWSWELLGRKGEITIGVLGAEIHVTSLWLATPLIVTVVSLALIGAMNATGATWRRLRKAIKELGMDFYFTDLDTHKNLLDYFGFLTPRPEKKIQEAEPSEHEHKRFARVGVFIYPSLIALGTFTTAFSRDRMPNGCLLQLYVWTSFAIQLVFSARIYWRALCGFLWIRAEENELI